MTQRTALLTAFSLCSLTIACGDSTSATGALGRIEYSLHSDYMSDDASLLEVGILVGHEQTIYTQLTKQGERAADNPGEISHRVNPAGSADIDVQDDGDHVPSLDITVHTPGTYTIESILDGEVFDYIDLRFESPDGLDHLTWLRAPGEGNFSDTTDSTHTVVEGTQVALLPIPTLGSERLVGQLDVELTADPEWAVVENFDVSGVYEQRVSGSVDPLSLYFIEPATVIVTMTDPANGVSASQTFEVTAVDAE